MKYLLLIKNCKRFSIVRFFVFINKKCRQFSECFGTCHVIFIKYDWLVMVHFVKITVVRFNSKLFVISLEVIFYHSMCLPLAPALCVFRNFMGLLLVTHLPSN